MTTDAFDTVTRRAAAVVTRRQSLLTLGGAALAASLASPDLSEAKKKGKDCKKKEKQRCSNDAAACKPTVQSQPLCDPGDPGSNPEGCLALQACCDECSANGFLTCLISISA